MTVNGYHRASFQLEPCSEVKNDGRRFEVWKVLLGILCASIIGAVFAWIFTPTSQNVSEARSNVSSESEQNELRLPRHFKPVSYDLAIQTFLPGTAKFAADKNLTFEGKIKIEFDVVSPSDVLVLHVKNLEIDRESISIALDGQNLKLIDLTMLPEQEKVVLKLCKVCESGSKVLLQMKYSGPINSNLGGFYQSKYTVGGEDRIAAVTQFAPIDARQMAPCMDEPEYKAIWKITVVHPADTTAISNGIEIRTQQLEDGFVSTEFKETPRMSSYLVAIFVSQFEFVEKTTASGVRFRIWARPEAIGRTKYALEAGVKCLEYYEKYFRIPFPLEKQDMVAVPDFAFGAMENWGLITYRETALLYDPNLSTPLEKRSIARIIAHELAHQWFGNLVTNEWWTDVWLNEGFATYVEHIGADFISDNEFRMSDVFLNGILDVALLTDDKSSSHPLSVKVEKASQINEIYDVIAYKKGASVIRMIRNVMGERRFNKGLNNYLSQYSYESARSVDLWRVLGDEMKKEEEGVNITHFALQWTTQLGFPYLTLNRLNSTTVEVTQTRYKVNPNAKEEEKYANPEFGFKWDVPVWYQAGSSKPRMVWMKRDEPLLISSNYGPIVLNAGAKAFVRQNYDDTEWKMIFAQLLKDYNVYEVATRHAIISDAFAMVEIGQMKYELLFDLLEYRKQETDYIVLETIRKGLAIIESYFGNEPESKVVKDYILSSFPRDSVAFSGQQEDLTTDMYQTVVKENNFKQTCREGSNGCGAKTARLFQDEVESKCQNSSRTSECISVTPSLRRFVYCEAVKNGDQVIFNQMMNFYRNENVQVERIRLLKALTCSPDPTTLKTLLTTAMDRESNIIRFQDVRTTFDEVSRGTVGKELIFNFLISRWEEIYKSFNSNHITITKIIQSCTNGIRTRQELNQLRNFRETAPNAMKFAVFEEQLEEGEHRVEWIEENLEKMTELFRERK